MISIMHEKLNLSTGSPVKIKWCDYDHFKYPLHSHGEYEIVYIIKSSGKRFVGKSIEHYTSGDLVLLGSFVPHMYQSDDIYYQNNSDLRINAIIIQFSKDFFSHAIHSYPEFHKIKKLLEDAKYGIFFKIGINDVIREKIENTLKLKSLNLLMECITILSLMSNSKEKRLLNNESLEVGFEIHDQDPRLIKILSLLHQEYFQSLSLNYIASLVGMNRTALCRFFKSKTGKTIFQYINELRINYACQLLLESKLTITQICYETGFSNISNFNQQFKKITNYSPTKYLEEFKKKL